MAFEQYPSCCSSRTTFYAIRTPQSTSLHASLLFSASCHRRCLFRLVLPISGTPTFTNANSHLDPNWFQSELGIKCFGCSRSGRAQITTSTSSCCLFVDGMTFRKRNRHLCSNAARSAVAWLFFRTVRARTAGSRERRWRQAVVGEMAVSWSAAFVRRCEEWVAVVGKYHFENKKKWLLARSWLTVWTHLSKEN